MTKAEELRIRKIIQEELQIFFAKKLGLVPIERKSGVKRDNKKQKKVE